MTDPAPDDWAWLTRPWGVDGSLDAARLRAACTGHLGGRVNHLRRDPDDQAALCGAQPKPGSRWRTDTRGRTMHNTCEEIWRKTGP